MCSQSCSARPRTTRKWRIMPRVDERLRTELERAARPAEPTGTFEGLEIRRERRRRRNEAVRRVRSGALALLVLAGTAGGFVALTGLFGDDPRTGTTSADRIAFGRVQLELFPEGGSSASGFQVWSVASDGSDLRRISAPGEEATTPAWSPDGDRIAFLETSSGGDLTSNLRLVTTRPDGSDRPVIADGLIRPAVRAVVWSPDGARIAVLDSHRKGLDALDPFGLPLTDIAIYSAEGAFERFVDVPGVVAGFDWAPDGSGFAAVRFRDATAELLRVDLEGRTLGTIASDVSSSASPAWSPDGSRIAFVRAPSSSTDASEGEVWVASADGANPSRITHDSGRKPSLAWSADGTRLLYSRQTLERCDIVSVAPDGSDRTIVAERSTMGGCAQELSVASGALDPSPSPIDPTRAIGREIGFRFRVCHVDSVAADFDGDGQRDTAYVVNKMGPDGCPRFYEYRDRFLGIDLDEDGLIDASRGPLHCDPWCVPFAAPDLNRDGRAELLLNEGHIVSPVSAWIGVYGVDGSQIRPITFPNGSNRFALEEVASVPS